MFCTGESARNRLSRAEASRLFVEDCGYFIDLSRSPMWAAKEHVIIDKKRIVAPLPKPIRILR